jgi:imidazoleglycerol-phosphate dehydratase/histidinol-phosphatase
VTSAILFIDRDGVLIEEPEDFQIDSFEKFRLVAGVIPALLRLRDAGFEFVMVSNQDGLGTPSFPRETFEGPHRLLLQILKSQGVTFREILIDESLPAENKPTRKPGIGMVLHYLRDRTVDLGKSAMVGDRDTDMDFAKNLGVRGFKLGPGDLSWPEIAHILVDVPRTAVAERKTKETQIEVSVDLDRASDPVIKTGLGFFDHMLEQLGKHGGFALSVTCAGDLHIDEHHTVEDTALVLGAALKQALGDKRGIGRYGFTLPMDETVATAVLDFSGRPFLVFDGVFPRDRVGDLPTELVPHFFRSLCETSGLNLHLTVRGQNAHHMVEACFKSVARALRQAIQREGSELPTTKGAL